MNYGRDAMNTLANQPVVAGAIAFALGAALAAVLPMTRKENEVMGEMADEIRDQASRVASEVYEKGRETASEVYEHATRKAGEVTSAARQELR